MIGDVQRVALSSSRARFVADRSEQQRKGPEHQDHCQGHARPEDADALAHAPLMAVPGKRALRAPRGVLAGRRIDTVYNASLNHEFTLHG